MTPRNLPAWAQSPVAIELLRAIIANPPESRAIRDDWGIRDHPSYSGKLAGRLRQIHLEWREREFSALDRQFAITHVWDDAASKAVLGAEDANQLIHRLLGEARREVARAA